MEREQVTTPARALQYFNEQYPERFSEIYEITGTYKLATDLGILKIETVKDLKTGRFDAYVYKKDSDSGTWVDWHNRAWCDRDSETEVLMQALSFLGPLHIALKND